jgi:hypothetical protein
MEGDLFFIILKKMVEFDVEKLTGVFIYYENKNSNQKWKMITIFIFFKKIF